MIYGDEMAKKKALYLNKKSLLTLKTLEKAGYKKSELISTLIIEASPFLVQRVNDHSKKGIIEYIYGFNRKK